MKESKPLADLKLIPLGRILRAHGVHGAVAAEVYNPLNPEGILGPSTVYLLMADKSPRPVRLTGRRASFGLILKIKDITTRTAAETLKGAELAVSRDNLPTPDEGEYYQTDLLGLETFLTTGKPLGRVADFVDTGNQLVLVIRDDRGWENLVPFSEDMVPEVDLANKRLVVADFPGLIADPPPDP
ncbi:MAG: ribosome maturation factor RimM [Deltaproteobacteria bacterium]|nr:ribosome maturation factor RimM [Deltaproteobacteria bacterium]